MGAFTHPPDPSTHPPDPPTHLNHPPDPPTHLERALLGRPRRQEVGGRAQHAGAELHHVPRLPALQQGRLEWQGMVMVTLLGAERRWLGAVPGAQIAGDCWRMQQDGLQGRVRASATHAWRSNSIKKSNLPAALSRPAPRCGAPGCWRRPHQSARVGAAAQTSVREEAAQQHICGAENMPEHPRACPNTQAGRRLGTRLPARRPATATTPSGPAHQHVERAGHQVVWRGGCALGS